MTFIDHADCEIRQIRPGLSGQLITDTPGEPDEAVQNLALFYNVVEPGEGIRRHAHEFEEILTVMEGIAEVSLNGERRVVGPGNSVFVPVGSTHGFTNAGSSPLRVQAVIASREMRGNWSVT